MGLVRRCAPRTDAREVALLHKLDRIRWLRPLFERRPGGWKEAQWEKALDFWRVYLSPRVGTYTKVAELCSVDRGTAERWISKARAVIEGRMRKAA